MDFEAYIKEIQGNLARRNATEHTHRSALKTLLESLQPGLVATNLLEEARVHARNMDSPEGYRIEGQIRTTLREVNIQIHDFRTSLP